ncbi:MAG: hypothetical protein ACYDAY_04220 [Candidatus Dormibacteria bacterium]
MTLDLTLPGLTGDVTLSPSGPPGFTVIDPGTELLPASQASTAAVEAGVSGSLAPAPVQHQAGVGFNGLWIDQAEDSGFFANNCVYTGAVPASWVAYGPGCINRGSSSFGFSYVDAPSPAGAYFWHNESALSFTSGPDTGNAGYSQGIETEGAMVSLTGAHAFDMWLIFQDTYYGFPLLHF